VRAFFIFNIGLWLVLFAGWLVYAAMLGWADPVSIHVRVILSITACLLVIQGFVRYRRARGLLPN